MRKEAFQAALRSWRERHPDPEDAYMSVIPRWVADSMALEGDKVDVAFLEENLGNV